MQWIAGLFVFIFCSSAFAVTENATTLFHTLTLETLETPIEAAFVIANNDQDAAQKSKRLIQIGSKYAQDNYVKPVIQLYQYTKPSNPNTALKMLQESALIFVKNGHVEEAISCIKAAENASEQYLIAEYVMLRLVKENNFESSEDIVSLIENKFLSSRLHLLLAQAYAQNNTPDKALDHLNLTLASKEKDLAFAQLISVFVQQNQTDKAITLLPSIDDLGLRQQTRITIVYELAKKYDFSRATALAIPMGQADVLARVDAYRAGQLASTNKMDEALEAMRRISIASIRQEATTIVAAEIAKMGDSDKAFSMIEPLKGAALPTESIYAIAKAFVTETKFDKAIETLQFIQSPSEFEKQLSSLGSEFGRGSSSHFALLTIKQLKPDRLKWAVLEPFLVVFSAQASIDKIQRILLDIPDYEIQKKLTLSVLLAYIDADKPKKCFDLVKSFTQADFKIDVLMDLATTLAQKNKTASLSSCLELLEQTLPTLGPVQKRSLAYINASTLFLKFKKANANELLEQGQALYYECDGNQKRELIPALASAFALFENPYTALDILNDVQPHESFNVFIQLPIAPFEPTEVRQRIRYTLQNKVQ